MIQPLVCIGGLGGSGTRVYARILQEVGVHLGNDLNPPLDNLLFTRFFKNPQWYSNKTEAEFAQRLSWFKACMNGLELSADAKKQIQDIFEENQCYKLEGQYDFEKLKHIQDYASWGWKEPNSHIFIEELATTLPDLKFILVIRDGLDMCFSPNIQQLTYWGKLLFGISFENKPIQIFRAQLNYWINANIRALKLGNTHFGSRFLVSKFEDIYTSPKKEISRILEFLDLKVAPSALELLSNIPSMPRSVNRYQNNVLNLDNQTLQLVKEINNGHVVPNYNILSDSLSNLEN